MRRHPSGELSLKLEEILLIVHQGGIFNFELPPVPRHEEVGVLLENASLPDKRR
jgi:hypothetical protein